TLCLKTHRPRVLALGQRGQVAVADDLQPAQTSDDTGEGEGQDAGEDEDPGAQVAHVRSAVLVTGSGSSPRRPGPRRRGCDARRPGRCRPAGTHAPGAPADGW